MHDCKPNLKHLIEMTDECIGLVSISWWVGCPRVGLWEEQLVGLVWKKFIPIKHLPGFVLLLCCLILSLWKTYFYCSTSTCRLFIKWSAVGPQRNLWQDGKLLPYHSKFFPICSTKCITLCCASSLFHILTSYFNFP